MIDLFDAFLREVAMFDLWRNLFFFDQIFLIYKTCKSDKFTNWTQFAMFGLWINLLSLFSEPLDSENLSELLFVCKLDWFGSQPDSVTVHFVKERKRSFESHLFMIRSIHKTCLNDFILQAIQNQFWISTHWFKDLVKAMPDLWMNHSFI